MSAMFHARGKRLEESEMQDADEFLTAVMPQLREVETAFCNGDATPRAALWSNSDTVTLFGAAFTRVGWREIWPAFESLASGFSDCTAWEYDVLAAGASGDIGYLVVIERKTASIRGAPPKAYALRVTWILRRDADEWHVIHRHGDPFDPDAEGVGTSLKSTR